jgi:hypothetical protein
VDVMTTGNHVGTRGNRAPHQENPSSSATSRRDPGVATVTGAPRSVSSTHGARLHGPDDAHSGRLMRSWASSARRRRSSGGHARGGDVGTVCGGTSTAGPRVVGTTARPLPDEPSSRAAPRTSPTFG